MIVIIILVILAVPFIAASFLSKAYAIEREVIIDKPRQDVFDYIRIIKNQQFYNKWVMADPGAKMEYRGTDGTIGFVSAWDSENKSVGKGEQEIIKINEGQNIILEIRFVKPFEGVSHTHLNLIPISANQTLVKWSFTGARNYTMKLFYLLFNLERKLGRDIDTSLNNLKAVLER